MTTHHVLPSGGWVDLKEAGELRARDRKMVMRQVADPVEGHRMGMAVEMSDLITATVVAAWDLPYLPGAPIPSTQLDILDELTLEDESTLQGLIVPLIVLFQPKEVTPDDATNPDGTNNASSPTSPSGA